MADSSRPSLTWRLAAVAVLFAGTTAVLVAVDRRTATSRVTVDGLWDEALLKGFDPYNPNVRARRGSERSEVVLSGLWPNAPIVVRLTLAPGQPDAPNLLVVANGKQLAEARLGSLPESVRVRASASRDGSLRLMFLNPGGAQRAISFRLFRLTVQQQGQAGVPLLRRLHYFTLPALAAAIVLLCNGTWATACVAAAASCFAAAGALGASRILFMGWLPWVLATMGLASLVVVAVRLSVRTAAIPLGWLALGTALRFAFALHPASQSADLAFHVHNLWRFKAGEVVTSRAPGSSTPLPVPYPPALYAIAAPFASHNYDRDRTLLRLLMALLETASPLLLVALMRSGGASKEAAGYAAVTAALMPEGVLVLAKGIAANITGSALTLVTLIALLRRAAAPVVMAVMSLTFLTHLGVTMSVVPLFLAWWAYQIRRGELTWGTLGARLACLTGALLIAYVVYYQEVARLLRDAAVTIAPDGTGIGWSLHSSLIKSGKTIQDLLLKFGALPLWLAWQGLTAQERAGELTGLLRVWLAVTALLMLLAITTPVTLRFEYFVVPAIAALAGIGAEQEMRRGRRGWLRATWAFCFTVQLAVAILILLGHFRLISAVLESDRWPFPVGPRKSALLQDS